MLGFDGSNQRMLTDSTSLHPGTGYNLPSGERIQLSQDGSRLLPLECGCPEFVPIEQVVA